KVIALKDLYELLEKVIDRCRDAGNVINHIVLKNS
ncbi:MAG: pit accessory protein, partial [Verrucomicrobia bacterium]